MALYLIGIGGTGAKCVEAVVQIAATGLLTEEPIRVLFIDPDESNGNLERARNSIRIYQNCYELIRGDKHQCPWLKTPIESFDIWSPFSQDLSKNLDSFLNYNLLKQEVEPLANFLDVLYTKAERNVSLDVGFRGRPAIGSAIMSQVTLDTLEREPWGTVINRIQQDVGSGKVPKIFLCGSLFGGTGASALPTIGQLIRNQLSNLGIRERVLIGGLLMLPYFQFSPPLDIDPDEVYARSDFFLLNTEASLRYYVTQAQEIFDIVYLLGSPTLSRVEQFSIGKNTQRNKSHFIELLAALALRDFLLAPPAEKGTVSLISRKESGRITWNDLPESGIVQSALVNTTRFAYVWLSNIVPELDDARRIGINRFQRLAPWFTQFFRSNPGVMGNLFKRQGEEFPDFSDFGEQQAISVISNWCENYLRWLSELHDNESENIQLFNIGSFADRDGRLNLKKEYLSDLVSDDRRDSFSKQRDTVQNLKERLESASLSPPALGTAGLAQVLYINCKL